MNVQGVNEVIYVEEALPDVEDLQNKGEERNTTEHHCREIADDGDEKNLQVHAILANLFFNAVVDPLLEPGSIWIVRVSAGFKERSAFVRFCYRGPDFGLGLRR